MPVDATQPVFPMPPGQAVEAVWGQAVSEHVIQRFTDVNDRNAKWVSPPKGAVCETLTPHRIWVHDGLQWVDLLGIYGSAPYINFTPLSSGWASGLIYIGTIYVSAILPGPALTWQFMMQINYIGQGAASGGADLSGAWVRTRIRTGGIDQGISGVRYAHDDQVTINDAMQIQRWPGAPAVNFDIYAECNKPANWAGTAMCWGVPLVTNLVAATASADERTVAAPVISPQDPETVGPNDEPFVPPEGYDEPTVGSP